MKRTLIILSSILVGLYIVLSLLGGKGDYVAERSMYKINKKFAKIQDDPMAAPEGKYSEVVEDYKKFMENFPDSKLEPFAHILIGRTYGLKRDYTKARSTFERMTQKYDDKPNMAAQALLEIANAYSQQDDVSGVIKTYERLIRDYPKSEQGLAAPLTLARIESAHNPKEGIAPFNKAINHYRSIHNQSRGSEEGFKSLHYIAGAHMAQENWRSAVNAYGEILLTYPESEYLTEEVAEIIIRSVNTLAIAQLKDYDLPIRIYGQFISKYPDHRLNPVLNRVIQGVNELKQQEMQTQNTQL